MSGMLKNYKSVDKYNQFEIKLIIYPRFLLHFTDNFNDKLVRIHIK